MNVLDYIAHETERQSGTVREGLGMYNAWRRLNASQRLLRPMEEWILISLVRDINGITQYRKVPAVFNQGVPALSAALIPNAMSKLIVGINENKNVIGYADYLTKSFLEIHPFADGNGRVGSLLWNWLNGTINHPEPMPYFFGEQ